MYVSLVPRPFPAPVLIACSFILQAIKTGAGNGLGTRLHVRMAALVWFRVGVELITRPFLPLSSLAPPIQEGSGNQTMAALLARVRLQVVLEYKFTDTNTMQACRSTTVQTVSHSGL